MPWKPPKNRPRAIMDEKPFWLTSLLRTVVTVCVAYVVAVFLQLVLTRVAQLPHGPLWSADFEGPFQFVLTIGTCVALSIPYWMKEWDASLRSFSLFSSVGLLSIAVFAATGEYNPNGPLDYLTQHFFMPLSHRLGYT